MISRPCLKLKLNKCALLQRDIEYLSHEICSDGIIPGRRKMQAVLDFTVSINVYGVRQFIEWALCV